VKFNPAIQHRQSIRLPEFDYRTTGAYFVTICTFERECILDELRLQRAVELSWRSANDGWEPALGDFIVMPNHVHGIVWISNVGVQRLGLRTSFLSEQSVVATTSSVFQGAAPLQRLAPLDNVRPGSLGAIVRTFKSLSTKRINNLRGPPGQPIWQRNYYERVIRDEDELQRVRQYILDNPAKWESDPNNPAIMRKT
jgi:REP element-mobilizing transposase RayT